MKRRLIIILIILGAIPLLSIPLLADAGNLLRNSGLEPEFIKYGEWVGSGHTFDLEVAHDWERFFVPAGTYNGSDNRLRYFRSSAIVGYVTKATEKRDGVDAQLFWSKNKFDAGIYQQITGLTPGESYGVQAGILQVYGETTRTPENGKMFRSVGLDPTGGTDPTSPNVIWGPEESRTPNWFYPGVGAQAISSTMTLFVRVRSLYDAPSLQQNSVWVDDTFMDTAPITSLSLTPNSATQVTAQWSGVPRSGFHLYAYDAQYRAVTDSTWTDLQIFSSTNPPSKTASRTFTVEPGVEYVVRARTWHEQDGGDSHEVPGPWVEQQISTGGILNGVVVDNQGRRVSGATIAVTGSFTTSATAADGSFLITTGAGDFEVSAGAGNWRTGQPLHVTVPTAQAIVPLTLTLRPPDDLITNGDFTEDLIGWAVEGAVPVTTTAEYRTGGVSLMFTDTALISQTGFISNTYNPALSFWYKLTGADGDDIFTAQLSGSEAPLTTAASAQFSTATVTDWQHVSLPLAGPEVYSGDLVVQFNLIQTGPATATLYLDEVSVGSTWGGSIKTYLPIVIK